MYYDNTPDKLYAEKLLFCGSDTLGYVWDFIVEISITLIGEISFLILLI